MFHEHELIQIIKKQNETIDKQAESINFLIKHSQHNEVHLVLTNTFNNSKFIIMALTIAANQKSVGVVALLDSVTQQPVTATFTNIAASSDNDAAFTTASDGAGNITITGVAAGTGNLVVTATAAYTDSTGAAQTQDLSVTIVITITAVVTADAVELTVNFAPPTAQ